MRYCAANGVQVDPETATAAVTAYRTGFARVPALWKRLEREVKVNGRITTPAGRALIYPGLREEDRQLMFTRHAIFSRGRKGHREEAKLWHGAITENLVQATARDVVFWEALQFMREGYRVVHLVHDEIVAVVPEAQADEAAERLLFWLRQAPPWAEGLPVDGEIGIGIRYSDAK
jgi:DNA polymerase